MKKLLVGAFLIITSFFFGSHFLTSPSQALVDGGSENGDGCEYVCPTVEWTHVYCPTSKSAYSSNDKSLPCSKKVHGRTKYATQIVGKSFSVAYNKSQDPHKCHRPSDSDLSNKYSTLKTKCQI